MKKHYMFGHRSLGQASVKLAIGYFLCLAIRFIPFRPPNVEPILAVSMPFARRFGPLTGFLFGALSIVAYDVLTGLTGSWTAITAVTYGCVAAGAWVLRRFRDQPIPYAIYALVGTLFFDAVTGVLMGPLLYGQPWMEALVGQVPFTLLHLLGNVTFALIVSPIVSRWIVAEPRLELASLRLLLGMRT